jgi:hypothetical protein
VGAKVGAAVVGARVLGAKVGAAGAKVGTAGAAVGTAGVTGAAVETPPFLDLAGLEGLGALEGLAGVGAFLAAIIVSSESTMRETIAKLTNFMMTILIREFKADDQTILN